MGLAGFVAEVHLGDFDIGGSAGIGGSIVGRAEDGKTWVFEPGQEQAARDFQSRIEREFAEDSIPVVNGINRLVELATGEEDVRGPDKVYTSFGVDAEAGAELTAAVASADAAVATGRKIGRERDVRTGESSILMEVHLSGEATVAAGFASAGVEGGATGTAKINYDADGNATTLVLTTMVRTDADATDNALKDADYGFGGTGTPTTTMTTREIDLDSPEARAFANGLESGDLAEMTDGALDAFNDARTTRVQYDESTTEFGLTVGGEIIAKVGGSAKAGGSTSEQVRMSYLGAPDPATGERQWQPLDVGQCGT